MPITKKFAFDHIKSTGQHRTSCTETKTEDKRLDLNLIPETKILSDYNHILTQNVEFFQTSAKCTFPSTNEALKGTFTAKVGLRCIHCAARKQYTTAATFFPSTINSIASGIGTIGARHFAQGKCPFVSENVLEALRSTKKSSQQQTRMQGRKGLDAYCKILSSKYGISNQHTIGIFVSENVNKTEEKIRKEPTRKVKIPAPTALLQKGENMTPKHFDRNDPSAFIEGGIENFWECGHCKNLPFPWRASGSVVFSAHAPSIKLVGKHLKLCQGKKPLRIPRDASIETINTENGPKVQVRWDNLKSTRRKSNRISHRAKPKRKNCSIAVNKGLEDDSLSLPEDKPLTTDFAYFTMQQLRKCYLTKSRGSRGNCPVGYSGLACVHCAGDPDERRFFYTSSDHLRNSFSHIPYHLMKKCPKCPADVKQKLVDFKCIRDTQRKSDLKSGSHKSFIDKVWDRLHGQGGGVIDEIDDRIVYDTNDAGYASDGSSSTISVDVECDDNHYKTASLNGRFFENKDIAMDPTNSTLILSKDRGLTTDYCYYAMSKMLSTKVTVKQTQILPKTKDHPALLPLRLKEIDHELNRDDCETSYRKGPDIVKHSLVCPYCEGHEDSFIMRVKSSNDLRTSFHMVAKHLVVCTKCPEDVKKKLKTFKTLRATQEALLKRGSQRKFTKLVWERISGSNTCIPPEECDDVPINEEDIAKNGLLDSEDRKLVTPYTFYTMLQMKGCILEKSGNGSRSMFEHGFPGLACIHCAATPSARKFFYRTSEILSGNYAHIPNHLFSCKLCPPEVKKSLENKKLRHADDKKALTRGSQRIFFNNMWQKLHAKPPLRLKVKGLPVASPLRLKVKVVANNSNNNN